MFPKKLRFLYLQEIDLLEYLKQIHFALGTKSDAKNIIGILADAIYKIPEINPFVFSIALLGVLVLIFYKKINNKFIKAIPAPMWVLVLALPIVYGFNFLTPMKLLYLAILTWWVQIY